MFKVFKISLALSIVIAAAIFYMAHANISEKRLLHDKGLEATANITGFEEVKGVGIRSNQTEAIKLYYTFRTVGGAVVDSYYVATAADYYNEIGIFNKNTLMWEPPGALDIIYLNEPPYLNDAKQEVLRTSSVSYTKSAIGIFMVTFFLIYGFGLLFLWGKNRGKAKKTIA